MKCPKCGSETYVLDTRPTERGYRTRRRRDCKGCNYRFATVEIPIPLYKQVSKRDVRKKKLRSSLDGI